MGAHLTQNAALLVNTSGQISITKPGMYVIAQGWTAVLSSSNKAAICIGASNVSLDLNGKSLTLSTTSHTPVAAGIELAPGVTDITITNGTINGASTYASMPVGITGIDNTRVKLSKLAIVGCDEAGISFSFSKHISIKFTSVLHTINTNGSAAGIKLSNCQNVTIKSSSCKKTQGGFTSTDFAAGIYANACNHCTFEEVNTSKNKSTYASAYGVFLQQCTDVVCTKVHANANVSKNATSTAAGFLLVNTDASSFIKCHANDNTSTTTGYARGFVITNATQTLLRKCVANNNTAPWGTSIGFENDSSKYTAIRSCKAQSNQGNSEGYGFLSSTGNGTQIFKSRAIGNTTKDGIAGGIKFLNETQGAILYCELLANNATLGTAFGIGLFQECFSSRISHNFLSKNRGPIQYGFYDESTYFTSFVRGNIAAEHGLTLSNNHQLLNNTATNYYIPSFRGNSSNLVQEAQTISALNVRNQIINISVNSPRSTNLCCKKLLTRSPAFLHFDSTDLWIPAQGDL